MRQKGGREKGIKREGKSVNSRKSIRDVEVIVEHASECHKIHLSNPSITYVTSFLYTGVYFVSRYKACSRESACTLEMWSA